MYILKITRLMMIKDYKLLIELHHILTEQVLGKYVKQSKHVKQSKYKMINFDNHTNENKTEHVAIYARSSIQHTY